MGEIYLHFGNRKKALASYNELVEQSSLGLDSESAQFLRKRYNEIKQNVGDLCASKTISIGISKLI